MVHMGREMPLRRTYGARVDGNVDSSDRSEKPRSGEKMIAHGEESVRTRHHGKRYIQQSARRGRATKVAPIAGRDEL